MTDIYPKRFLEFLNLVEETNPACRRFPDVFFPEDWGYNKPEATKLAKEICNKCHIQKQCLNYALEANEQEGIWGGETAYARQTMRKRIK